MHTIKKEPTKESFLGSLGNWDILDLKDLSETVLHLEGIIKGILWTTTQKFFSFNLHILQRNLVLK